MILTDALNPSQLKAVTTIDGPVLVIAGAGTGKTRVVTYRTAHLIDSGVDPRNILLLTFSVKAAGEMKERASQLVGNSCEKLTAENFHRFSGRMLRKFGPEVNVPRSFNILDAESAVSEIRQVMLSEGLDVKSSGIREYPTPNQIASLLSWSRNNNESLDDLYEERHRWYGESGLAIVKTVIKRYRKVKRRYGYLDFDDLLFKLRELLRTDVGPKISARYKYVMVDEYQDTNLIQARITSLLSKVHHNVMGVGDPNQTLYSWRGAYIDNMYQFETRFPGTRVVYLEDNYRSYQPILNVANQVLKFAETPYSISLRANRGIEGAKPAVVIFGDRAEQYTTAAVAINKRVREGASPDRFAVLARSMSSLRRVEMEMSILRIPYVVYGGIRFSEVRHVKDVFAILRTALNPRDVISSRRTLSLVPGVGPKTAEKLSEAMRRSRGIEPLADPPGAARRASSASLMQLYDVLRDIDKRSNPFDAFNLAFTSFYRDAMKAQFREDDIEWRVGEIRQVMSIAKRYKRLRRFINDVIVEGSADRKSDSGESKVVLSTIHSAKGLEFDVVYIMDMVEGWLPNGAAFDDEAAMEEERRCAYVAITRARDELYLYAPLTYDPRTGLPRQLSRFIRNMGGLLDVKRIQPQPQQRWTQTRYKRF